MAITFRPPVTSNLKFARVTTYRSRNYEFASLGDGCINLSCCIFSRSIVILRCANFKFY